MFREAELVGDKLRIVSARVTIFETDHYFQTRKMRHRQISSACASGDPESTPDTCNTHDADGIVMPKCYAMAEKTQSTSDYQRWCSREDSNLHGLPHTVLSLSLIHI